MLILLQDLLRRTRQHHAIEHATLHMLAARHPQRSFAAYSDPLGFTLYGDIDEAGLRRAVGDALLRLQAGETQLALHPNCGTNLATSTFLATLAALAAMSGSRRNLVDRFAGGLALVLAALVVAKPLGLWLQGYTTNPEVADRWVAEIRQIRAGALQAYRVSFE
jgi:hypothetical protein